MKIENANELAEICAKISDVNNEIRKEIGYPTHVGSTFSSGSEIWKACETANRMFEQELPEKFSVSPEIAMVLVAEQKKYLSATKRIWNRYAFDAANIALKFVGMATLHTVHPAAVVFNPPTPKKILGEVENIAQVMDVQSRIDAAAEERDYPTKTVLNNYQLFEENGEYVCKRGTWESAITRIGNYVQEYGAKPVNVGLSHDLNANKLQKLVHEHNAGRG